MTFNFYSLWIDPIFYISVAVFVLFLFLLVYSIRRYMAIGNSEQEEPVNIEVLQKQEIPLENVSPEIPQEQEMEMPIENLEQESLATEVQEQEQVMKTPIENLEQEVLATKIQEQEEVMETPIENLEQESLATEVLEQEEVMETPIENLEQESLVAEVLEQEEVIETPIENLEQESVAAEVLEQEEVMETPVEEPILAEQETEGMVGQTPVLQEQVIADTSEAEGFVKGIFNGISDIDERLKAVESTLSERKLNGDFALRYLEDIIDEYESMDKTGVKSRIEYLIADLKK